MRASELLQSSYPVEPPAPNPSPRVPAEDWQTGSGGVRRRNNVPRKSRKVSMVRAYKFYFTAVTTGDASATIQIPRSGTILGVNWSVAGISGAAVDGQIQYELASTSVRTTTTNDVPGTTLSQVSIAGPVASARQAVNNSHPIGVSITAGDKLYIHTLATGTAFGSVIGQCTVFINH